MVMTNKLWEGTQSQTNDMVETTKLWEGTPKLNNWYGFDKQTVIEGTSKLWQTNCEKVLQSQTINIVVTNNCKQVPKVKLSIWLWQTNCEKVLQS